MLLALNHSLGFVLVLPLHSFNCVDLKVLPESVALPAIAAV